MLHQRIDSLFLISRSHRKGIRIDAVYLAEHQIVLHDGKARIIKPGPQINIAEDHLTASGIRIGQIPIQQFPVLHLRTFHF